MIAEGSGCQISIESPSKVTSHVKADWKHTQVFHAFWWVKTTHDKDEATMKLIKAQVSEFKIPAYENIKALKPWDPLFVYVPEPAAAAEPSSKKARNA